MMRSLSGRRVENRLRMVGTSEMGVECRADVRRFFLKRDPF
jgi:hypothetical protein